MGHQVAWVHLQVRSWLAVWSWSTSSASLGSAEQMPSECPSWPNRLWFYKSHHIHAFWGGGQWEEQVIHRDAWPASWQEAGSGGSPGQKEDGRAGGCLCPLTTCLFWLLLGVLSRNPFPFPETHHNWPQKMPVLRLALWGRCAQKLSQSRNVLDHFLL